jgi:drug/metabolite transporter (DMT)-like permease
MNKTSLGVIYGMMAGALWGAIFLAPKLVPDFSAMQLSTAR